MKHSLAAATTVLVAPRAVDRREAIRAAMPERSQSTTSVLLSYGKIAFRAPCETLGNYPRVIAGQAPAAATPRVGDFVQAACHRTGIAVFRRRASHGRNTTGFSRPGPD